jgi:hypothetical protein
MALLTEIANDRLVIMVTHNPELAETYATRTVNLLDGQLADDSDPYWPEEGATRSSQKSTRKTSMSFLTAVALSFNNLMTKKGRTLMTAFAGSIGIIGIAAILALANGVNEYIASVEEDALSLYPLTIQSQGMDFTSLFAASGEMAEGMDEGGSTDTAVGGADVRELRMMTRMFESVGSNDLAALKVYLDGNGGGINDYVNLIQYSYNVTPQIFSPDTSEGVRQVNPDTTFSALGFGESSNALMASSMNTNVFGELVDDLAMIEGQYDVVAGRWPAAHNETVVVLTPNGGVSDFMAYAMGLRDAAELDAMVEQMINDEEIVTPGDTKSYTYDQIMGVSFKLVNATDYYAYDEQYDVWTDKRTDTEYLKQLVENGEDIRVVGVIRAKDGATATALQPGIYYTSALTAHLVSEAAGTEIVRMQLDEPATNVFSGRTFLDEEENPDRDGFDLASLVTVDEDAMASMFSFDASQLAFDASALDISMEDFSLDPSAMPALDTADLLAGLDLDDALAGLDLTEGLGEIDLEAALAGIDFAALIDGIDFGVDAEQAADVANRMVQGYLEFCTAEGLDPVDTQANFPPFLESTDGQAILAEAEALFGGAETGLSELQSRLIAALTESLGDAVQSQIDSISAAIGEQLQASMAAYMQQVLSTVAEQVTTELGTALQEQIGAALESSMGQLTNDMSSLMGMDADSFSEIFQFNMDEEELTQLMLSMMVTEQSSYDGNLAKLGYADFAKPSSIHIYPRDFESKGRVIEILDGYNEQMEAEGADDKVITYTDIVGTLMSSVTDIVNVVSYVLVAFVAISLVVSSIMIGVITYISVLERIKEIGILRSIGASKRDIRRVFNAETLIVGFVAGLLGIGVTSLLIIPANAVIQASFDIENVAILPGIAAAALVVISMGLTFLAGLIPSSAASRMDPVEALRTE